MDKHTRLVITAALFGLLSACGGGGDDSPADAGRTLPVPPPAPAPGTPAKGRFVDSAVQGLSYACGAATGLTNGSGEFDFLFGQNCVLRVGGIALGSTAGDRVLTPRALVAGAIDETHPTVNNIARLLQSLDDDGDPSNGIVIADSVRNALASATLNVAATPAAFAAAAQALLGTVMPGRTLVDSAPAAAHLKATLLSLFDGDYNCGYVGSASGTVTVQVRNGVITGSGQDDESRAALQVNGTLQSSGAASIGSTNSGATFTGTFYVSGHGSGTWSDSEGSGAWQCVRL
jgi:hypothetical protein